MNACANPRVAIRAGRSLEIAGMGRGTIAGMRTGSLESLLAQEDFIKVNTAAICLFFSCLFLQFNPR